MTKLNASGRIYAALSLRKKSGSEKVTNAKHIYDCLKDNSNFPDPKPTLDVLEDSINLLKDALSDAYSGSELDSTKVVMAENKLENVLVRLQKYVENVANEDQLTAVTVILSAGLKVRNAWQKQPIPGVVEGVRAIYNYHPGTILVKWRGVKYARYYNLYMTTNTEKENWKLIVSSPSKKAIVENLQSGKYYYFRIEAVGTAGASHPSVIVACYAA